MPIQFHSCLFALIVGILQMNRLLTSTAWKGYKESTLLPWLMVP